ncbi:MAG: hypothetical protein PUI16_09690 [Clostridia bacterium]|nr:hypothetical protein [Clostridia bacterium]MDY5554576.1 hypothetical protein [Blautia sp.]
MKRKRPLCRKAVQFCYDHPDLDKTLACIRKSADEVNKMLNKMCEKEKKRKK